MSDCHLQRWNFALRWKWHRTVSIATPTISVVSFQTPKYSINNSSNRPPIDASDPVKSQKFHHHFRWKILRKFVRIFVENSVKFRWKITSAATWKGINNFLYCSADISCNISVIATASIVLSSFFKFWILIKSGSKSTIWSSTTV